VETDDDSIGGTSCTCTAKRRRSCGNARCRPR
jgi:hypothetical protein